MRLLEADGLPRRPHRRRAGRWYRIRLDPELVSELERVAAERHLAPEALLTSIDQVILRERLVNAVLDDSP